MTRSCCDGSVLGRERYKGKEGVGEKADRRRQPWTYIYAGPWRELDVHSSGAVGESRWPAVLTSVIFFSVDIKQY